MVYIAIRKVKGINYYYIVKSSLVNGKSKQEIIKYLGSEKEVIRKLGVNPE